MRRFESLRKLMTGSCHSDPKSTRDGGLKALVQSGWLVGAQLGALWLLLFFAAPSPARAALQFDAFLGYDWIVPQPSWFPVVIEVDNDGPTFTGVIEVEASMLNGGQTRRMAVELPTGTLKRLVIPVFSSARGYSGWDVRLFDERGKLREERTNLRPRKQVAAEAPILAALARTSGGSPVIEPTVDKDSELAPASARMVPSLFPDNPLVLEGLRSIYLNTAKAPELSVGQVRALLAWLNDGGHLIVGVEQISEVAATPWLNDLLPCDLKDVQSIEHHPELQQWLKRAGGPANLVYSPNRPPSGFAPRYGRPQSPVATGNLPGRAASLQTVTTNNPFSQLTDDIGFETNALQVAVGKLRDGQVLVETEDTHTPLIVTADRGRGRVTALLFSPEREPFRSWKNQPAFWAELTEVPALWYVSADARRQGGWSSDGIFGAMIDSRQVHKLPVGWLLLLLIVYLAVIGPFDQFWLKKIGKPMLTWITFPTYVVCFSLLIYFIGYKLRAGESEWNELHLVDVLLHGEEAELRGRTYASVYSPVNQKYPLEGDQPYATLRGEFAGSWSGGAQANERATIWQNGDNFKAEIFVPVWTSQLFVSDWWQPAALPFTLRVSAQADGWSATVENRTGRRVSNLVMVAEDYLFNLGNLEDKQTKTFTVAKSQGTPLKDFVIQHGAAFQRAVESRQSTFGSSGRLDNLPDCAVAASFLSQLGRQENRPNQYNYANFVAAPGLDLSPLLDHGRAVLLAWDSGYSPTRTMCRFSPRRKHQDTLWRVAAEIK